MSLIDGRVVPVPISATPSIITGIGVIVASDDGYVRFYSHGLDRVFWERRVDSPVYASLVLDIKREHVIIAATSGLITCFDLRGRVVWSHSTGYPIFATPTIIPSANLLIVAGDCPGFR